MTSDALSPWDRERVARAKQAYQEVLDRADLPAVTETADLDQAILAAIRAVEDVKPPEARSPLPDASPFFRKLETALRVLCDPGTDVDTANGFNGSQKWQDFWVTVQGVGWFISCRPNRRFTQLPVAPAPERYDSLGRPSGPTD